MSKLSSRNFTRASPWIWAAPAPAGPNVFCRFRRTFTLEQATRLRLHLTADSRYWLYVNGTRVGHGPPRGWPGHWTVDTYEVAPFVQPGTNTIAVLVNHWRDGNFQYLPAPPGLMLRLEQAEEVILETDARWRAGVAPAELAHPLRISVQEPFEEHYDATLEDGWREKDYDDGAWPRAVVVPSPHARLVPRDIPFLGGEILPPARVLAAEIVGPCAATWSLSLKASFAPEDRSSNFCFVRGFVVTQVHTRAAQTVELIRPHHHEAAFWVNGESMPALKLPPDRDVVPEPVRLRAGWNTLVFPFPGYADALSQDLPAGGVHLPVFVLVARARQPLRWACRGAAGGGPWAFAGPFPLTVAQREKMERHVDWPRVVQAASFSPDATDAIAQAIPTFSHEQWHGHRQASWLLELPAAQISTEDVFAASCGDVFRGTASVEQTPVVSQGSAQSLTVHPVKGGGDVRVLFDFGGMVMGYQAFTVDAAEGTLVDLVNFEFIQPDGRHNLATGMNNSLRYRCRAGAQSFHSLQRRGFRYAWLIVRHPKSPVKLSGFVCHVSTYPQARRGAFQCSDELLNKIWRTGAHTLRLCAEDTYTDCPTYEQTHWVGDARNEALVDWVANGDPRLWFHCLEQAARGLERLPLVPSHVPSAWENILPAWSFLWMRSCLEYLRWTGDVAGARRLLPWVRRNVRGIEAHLTEPGLFRIRAWNMFDWAAMDTPNDGIVTHQNCLAVAALRDAAELAAHLNDRDSAKAWRRMADRIAAAINRHLWDARRRAYLDCIRADGRRSAVFSQQTQTAALVSGVAGGARKSRCRSLVARSPKDFVKAGSPFFEFFVLEQFAREGEGRRLLELIRLDWGFMIEQGATTFWELWSLKSARLTRSHCHGWSSAPTFFLSSAILGVQPSAGKIGEILFAPEPGNLCWLRGTVATAAGLVTVQGEKRSPGWFYRIEVPAGCQVRHDLPRNRVQIVRMARSRIK